MKKETKGIILVLTSTLFTAIGQFSFKKASANLAAASLVFNPYLYVGGIVYVCALLLLTYGLGFGRLNRLYPLFSLNIIWVLLISVFILQETISGVQLAGISLIIWGVIMVTGGV